MKICKCGNPITHSSHSNVCLKCRKSTGIKNPRTIKKTTGLNEGKMYIEYNPGYRKENFSVSPQLEGKERAYTKEESEALTDKLNRLTRRGKYKI